VKGRLWKKRKIWSWVKQTDERKERERVGECDSERGYINVWKRERDREKEWEREKVSERERESFVWKIERESEREKWRNEIGNH
jgi:hypothetical protein